MGLNEEQYLSICQACDQALLAPVSTVERVAIPWLHVIREHPIFLDNYFDLIQPTKDAWAITRQWIRFAQRRAWWFRQIVRALCSNGQYWFGPKELPRQIDVLFISHLINVSHAGDANDFYFGELPNKLVTQGHSSVIALINYSSQSSAYLADKWKGAAVPHVVFSISLRIFDEIRLRLRLKKESQRLKEGVKKEMISLSRRVLARAAEEALSSGSHTTLRIGMQVGALVAKLQPKKIVVTHEGHAWERIAFAAARRAHPGVCCIGYQHSAVFRLQHAIRRNIAPEYNPDQILTAGSVSKAQLEGASGLKGIPISILGSNRNFKINVKSPDYSPYEVRKKDSNNRTCLVLPEGIARECHLLFEFSLECAKAYPETQFIWRLHPIMSMEALASQNPKLKRLPKNIFWSQATLEEDIYRSSWALYRGTTAIAQAVVAGLRPIYLMLPGELTIDPLYNIEEWRVKVATISDFQEVINSRIFNNIDSNAQLIESKITSAKKYCEKIFMPFNIKALL